MATSLSGTVQLDLASMHDMRMMIVSEARRLFGKIVVEVNLHSYLRQTPRSTVSLPEGYADNDVDIWLYSFNVPVFAGGPPKSSTTPRNIVVVGDSTGALLNSSSFQTVEQKDTSCENVKGTLDFFFYTDVDTSVCQSVGVHWEPNNVTNWKAPMDLFVVPERQPPIHVPVANPNDMTINYTLALEPGTGFLFTMTDLGGSGGVSGWNVAGASEYIGSECLQSNSPYTNAMPSPTATLSNVRMPDYTGTISSTVTSDGVISTVTSIEKVENGSVASGNDLSNGGIAGLSIGIAAFAAIVAALISWCVWRRRHGRGVVFWDLPDDADGMLSKGEARGPIDRRFLKEQGARQASLQSSVTAPMLPLSPTTDSSEERDRRISVLAPSESSYVDSPFETFDANDLERLAVRQKHLVHHIWLNIALPRYTHAHAASGGSPYPANLRNGETINSARDTFQACKPAWIGRGCNIWR